MFRNMKGLKSKKTILCGELNKKRKKENRKLRLNDVSMEEDRDAAEEVVPVSRGRVHRMMVPWCDQQCNKTLKDRNSI